ncbi:MAG: hypothetical protein JJE50_12355, partial [Actinomycetales bacterium]|nr:hypothetical protein [Actinomycetales bacterium]
MSRTRTLLAVLTALDVLVLGGCMKVDGNLELSSRNTVSGTVLVAISSSWALANGEDPTNLADTLAEELDAAPDVGVTGEPYDDGEFVGMSLTLTDVQIDRVAGSTSGALTITRLGGDYLVNGSFAELDPTVEGDEVVPWTVQLSLTFPGAVSEHDGVLDGRTVTWDLTPDQPSLHARASAGGSGTLAGGVSGPLLLLLAFVGVAAVLVWRFGRRRRAADE